MTARIVDIRNAVASKITTDAAGYVITDLSIQQTYYPQTRLEELDARPFVRIVGLTFDYEKQVRDNTKKLLQLPVQVNLIRHVDPDDTTTIDTLVELLEQIQDSCALAAESAINGNRYSWNGNEALRDENGLIYDYEKLRTANCFLAVFTANYVTIKQ